MTICENIEYYTDLFDAQNGDIGLKNTNFRNEITGISYSYLGLTPLSHYLLLPLSCIRLSIIQLSIAI